MPVHRRSADVLEDEYRSLVSELADELKGPQPSGQPIILEDRTAKTNSLRVHVIWEKWENWAGEIRSEVITDAYEQAFPPEQRPEITFALGLNLPEAVAIGLLPFRVRPRNRRGKPYEPLSEEYQNAMMEAGGTMRFGGKDPQVRCATIEAAEATVERLRSRLPNSEWTITEEVGDPYSA